MDRYCRFCRCWRCRRIRRRFGAGTCAEADAEADAVADVGDGSGDGDILSEKRRLLIFNKLVLLRWLPVLWKQR